MNHKAVCRVAPAYYTVSKYILATEAIPQFLAPEADSDAFNIDSVLFEVTKQNVWGLLNADFEIAVLDAFNSLVIN